MPQFMGVELSCVATGIGDGRMAAASRAGVMLTSMAACGVRELGDEVDEGRAARRRRDNEGFQLSGWALCGR